MNFDEMQKQFPVHFARGRGRLNDDRLAQLLDRGDHTALGEYVLTVFENVKYELEMRLENPEVIEFPTREPRMLLPQAD